ncbi:hypothetical protein [Sphingobium cloacae]|uniref:Uncharacterized protein n=1 Tax=Sphingobium cloacae TaxID=120107 RepID=A0A1E1F4C4_9SPHN|nr:hypothetical protein [Sphingobium cloacae]BAV65366.1 hypothetical protein SCLO_1023260 [Sphingobium cloacae]
MSRLSSQHLREDVTAKICRSASEWVWRPWYAKLWWSAIPVWWIGMTAASVNEPVARFYDGALAGFLNVLFFPMTALLFLGVGFVRHWIDGFIAVGAGPSSEVGGMAVGHASEFARLDPSIDIFDPRSGTLYVGNPENQTHD